MATTNTNLAYINKLDQESIQNLANLYNQQGIHSGTLTDMTSQFKQNTGRDNTIGTTIGNASLNNYGYSVVDGQIRQTGTANQNNAPGWFGTTNADGHVNSAQEIKAMQPTQTQLAQESTALQSAAIQAQASREREEAARKAEEEKAYYANAYMNLYNDYENRLRANNDEYVRYLGEANQNQLNLINQNADNAARQYYQNYLSQKYALPEQLSNLGITGGASETAALGLMSNYSQNLGQNETNRNTNIANQNIEYNRILAENSKNLADQLADTYLSMAQKQIQLDMDNREKAEADMKQNAIDTWNSNVSANMQARLKEGKDVYSWYDNNGKLHYSTNEDNARGSGYEYTTNASAKKEAEEKAASEAKAKEIEATNQKVEKAAMDAYDKGSEVYIWHDDDGYLHWSTSKVRAAAESDKFVTIAQPKASTTGTSSSSRNPGSPSSDPDVDDDTPERDPDAAPKVDGTFEKNSHYVGFKNNFARANTVTTVANIMTQIEKAFNSGTINIDEYVDLTNIYANKMNAVKDIGSGRTIEKRG